MANRAFYRDQPTLQREQVTIEGQIFLTGSAGGITTSDITINGLTGSLARVLSGSSPNQFVSQYPVVRLASGSYQIQLTDVYPKLLACQLTLASSGSSYGSWAAHQDNGGVSRYDITSPIGVNAVRFSLLSGSSTVTNSGARVLADPLETGTAGLTVNVSLKLANTSI